MSICPNCACATPCFCPKCAVPLTPELSELLRAALEQSECARIPVTVGEDGFATPPPRLGALSMKVMELGLAWARSPQGQAFAKEEP